MGKGHQVTKAVEVMIPLPPERLVTGGRVSRHSPGHAAVFLPQEFFAETGDLGR
jgi:hypothetical protein